VTIIDQGTGVSHGAKDGLSLKERLEASEALMESTGRFYGLDELELKTSDPIGYEKLFSRLRGGIVNARETAKNISASPTIQEQGELCFALYTPEGDSIALSTGIIVHVHTMSDAIKWMIRNEYEKNPGIKPGDIFANNQPTIGDVHPADVQTFVPIFWEEELVGWVGGVIHVMDIGASSPGAVPCTPTTRFEDGIDLFADKIGENDEISPSHWKRVSMMSRAPNLYLLDERTRLAGCHLIRDAVERVIADEGIERYRQFSHEVIEDGRRAFKSRVRGLLIPGRYRSPGFHDIEFAKKAQMPARAQRDIMMHTPYEVELGDDGTFALNLDGSSAWGWHPFNATPSGQAGLMWILFTQTLICNDKVNDGAYYATRMNITPGTCFDPDGAPCSSGTAWVPLFTAGVGYFRSISRALQSRGFIEEIMGAYSYPGNVMQGGGVDQYGNFSGYSSIESAAQGQGAKYILDGLDNGAAVFNPEGDMGDIEAWEMVMPFIYLGRRRLPNSGGFGRHRGGTSHESMMMVWETPDYEIENITTGQVLSSPGLFGGYPAPTAYVHTIHGPKLRERAAAEGFPYPLGDGTRDKAELDAVEGTSRRLGQDGYTLLYPVETGDLYLSVYRGAGGLGDPLLRPVESIELDIEENHILPEYAESVYRVSDRDAERKARLAKARPVAEWWAEQRERVLAQDVIDPIKVMYAESMRLSPTFAAEYRGFWDLPEDFEFDAHTPTVKATRSEPGKVTPLESAEAYLERSKVWGAEGAEDFGLGQTLSKETLADMLDEKLSRRTVKDIQSGIKDGDRFDKWVAVLQERVPYTDEIVLPFGEALNIVRRASDGELVIRTDGGADLCGWKENWKMHAVMYVRDTVEAYREIYAEFGHPQPEWMELREFYCPVTGRLLETEAVPPGYPIVHEYLPNLEGFYEGWLGRPMP
jgi:N-methylhydantoinase B